MDKGEPTSVFAERVDRRSEIRAVPSFTRTLEHTEQAASAGWQSENHDRFGRVVAQQTLDMRYVSDSAVGAREAAELAAMMAAARVAPPAAAPPKHFDTTSRVMHNEKPWAPVVETRCAGLVRRADLTGQTFGARVMKDLDWNPAHHDPVWLAEAQLAQKNEVDRIVARNAGGPPAADFARTARLAARGRDIPVSIYSEAVAKGTFGRSLYGSAPFSGAPFARDSNFSKPISELNKVVDE